VGGAEQQAAAHQAYEQQPAYEQRQAYAPPPPAPAGPALNTSSKIPQLKELAGLRDAAVLNGAEFEVEKRKIFGR
jgi:hypothetical protein